MDVFDAVKIIQTIQRIDVLVGDREIRCLESESIAKKNVWCSLVGNTDIKPNLPK
jgi:hypothetical protein